MRLDKEQEKWAIFWCDLLTPVIYAEIDPDLSNRFLKQLAAKEIRFPNGRIGKPSLSTLRRKLNRYRQGGFDALERKIRNDRKKPRNISAEVINTAIELKKEQPRRSPTAINRFLEEMYAVTVPRSTLYRHLKQAGATRIKLGVMQKKVRKRWTRNHTHDYCNTVAMCYMKPLLKSNDRENSQAYRICIHENNRWQSQAPRQHECPNCCNS